MLIDGRFQSWASGRTTASVCRPWLRPSKNLLWKIGWFAALGFWQIVNYGIYTLLAIAFCYRVADTMTHDAHKSEVYRLLSFQFLSSAAPLIWMKLLTIFDLCEL